MWGKLGLGLHFGVLYYMPTKATPQVISLALGDDALYIGVIKNNKITLSITHFTWIFKP